MTARRLLRRPGFWGSAIGLLLAAVVAGALLLLPRVLNSEAGQRALRRAVQDRWGVQFGYSQLEVRLLPPQVAARGVTVSLPARLTVRARSLLLIPAVSALLRGEVEAETLRLDGADVRLVLPAAGSPETPSGDTPGGPGAGFAGLAGALDPRLALSLPPAKVVIEDSALEVVRAGAPLVRLAEIRGTLQSGATGVRAELSGNADVAGSVAATLEANRDAGQLRGELRELRVAELARRLGVDQAVLPGDSRADLSLEVQADRALHATYTLALHDLRWPRPEGEIQLGSASLAGSATLDSALQVGLESLQVPLLGLTGRGRLRWDPESSQVSAGLEVDEARWGTLRPLLLEAAPDNPTFVQIDSLVRAGVARQIKAEASGPSWGALLEPTRLAVQTELSGVDLYLPWAELELTGGGGLLGFRGGVFSLDHARGSFRGSRFDQGNLRAGPFDAAVPLQLSAEFDVDLADLPAVLRRAVSDPGLYRALDGIDELGGRARGRLELGSRGEGLQVAVDAALNDLLLRHRGVPLPLRVDGGSISFRDSRLDVAGLQGSAGRSTFNDISGHLDLAEVPTLHLDQVSARLALADLEAWLAPHRDRLPAGVVLPRGGGVLTVAAANLSGALDRPGQWLYRVTGALEDVFLQGDRLGRLAVPEARFTVEPGHVEVPAATVAWMDVITTGSVSLEWGADGSGRMGISLDSTLGERGSGRLLEGFGAPGNAASPPPQPAERRSDAAAAGENSGRVRGVLEGRWPAAAGWQGATAAGWLDVEQLQLPELAGWLPRGGTLERARVRVAERTLVVEELVARLPDQPLRVSGTLAAGAGRLGLDLDVAAETFDITPWLAPGATEPSAAESPDPGEPGPVSGRQGAPSGMEVEGSVRLRCERFRVQNYQWAPLHADLRLAGDTATVEVSRAELCGLSTPATLVRRGDTLSLGVKTSARGQSLQDALACLGLEDMVATGTFDLNGELRAKGPAEDLLSHTKGSFRLHAVEGRVHRLDLLAKAFAVLNVTELFRGRLPDMGEEGFGYETLDTDGTVAAGVVQFREGILDARSMKLLWHGNVDLPAHSLDLTLVVAPLKTVDAIVSWIPVVNYLLDDSLIAIPVGVQGPLEDPLVIPLSPASVGESLLGFTKRVLNLPFRVVQPLMPGSTEQATPAEPSPEGK